MADIKFNSNSSLTGAGLVLSGGGGLAVLTPQTAAWYIALVSVIIGLALLIFATKINGRHLWRAWWKGRVLPLGVRAYITMPTYPPGVEVGGIKWREGFRRVTLTLSNGSKHALERLNLVIGPEMPIARACCHSDFANCTIGPVGKAPPMIIMGEDHSSVIGIPMDDDDENFEIGFPYRLVCEVIPAHTEIVLDLAVVQLSNDVMSPGIWERIPPVPRFMDIYGMVTHDGHGHEVRRRLLFKEEGQ